MTSPPVRAEARTSVRVQVPATTANLGPGYDVLGLALQVYNYFTLSASDRYSMAISGPRAASFGPLPEDNLLVRAVQRLCQEVGKELPPLSIQQEVHIPPARGMGSSSTAIVGGLMGANALLGSPLNKDQLVQLASDIEGHPDNVTPSLLGGLMLCMPEDSALREIALPIPTQLCWGVCIPNFELSTQAAREALPPHLNYRDVVTNTAYQSALVAGLCSGQLDWFKAGLRDRIHQPYRQALVPGMAQVVAAAQEHGALGCVLSGAGPTLLAIWEQGHPSPAEAMLQSWKKEGVEAEFVTCLIDRQGAQCLDCQ